MHIHKNNNVSSRLKWICCVLSCLTSVDFQCFIYNYCNPVMFAGLFFYFVFPKLPNTYESCSAFLYDGGEHPSALNGTCHGPRMSLSTKDDCDLDKHRGGKHKGKGQVLFQFKCAAIHLQHNGHKELQLYRRFQKRGVIIPASRRRRRKRRRMHLYT